MAKGDRTRASSGRGRSAPVAVKKPFPWGTVAVSVVLAAALIGILVYAAANTGSGRRDVLKDADKGISGLKTFDDLSRNHVAGAVTYPGYPGVPPTGGDHNAVPQQCQVYTEPIAPEHAVHSLEHGAVWVTYRPDLPADEVEELSGEVEGDPYRILSPLPGQTSPIELTAWGRQVGVDKASDGRVGEFLSAYTNGPQTPEKGASCAGTTASGADASADLSGAGAGAMNPSASPSATP